MEHAPNASTPDLNATVLASAGTGKTWLLVTRLVRLLMGGARPDAILAITFTRKAAAEMQSRLAERLLELARAGDDELDSQLRELHLLPSSSTRTSARRLYEQLLRYPHPVRTTTFHAFCQTILRRFPLEADIPPGFELAERTGDFRRAAWDALLSEVTGKPDTQLAEDLERLLDYCGSQFNLTHSLNAFLEHRSDWWAFTEGAEDPLATARKILCKQFETTEDYNPYPLFFTPERAMQLEEFSRLLARHPTKTHLGHLEKLEVARNSELPEDERFRTTCALFFTREGKQRQFKVSSAKTNKMDASERERFVELAQSLHQAALECQQRIASLHSLKANLVWQRAGSRLLEHYQRIKLERRTLDFVDLEWRAYRLLTQTENAQWVQFKLDQRIDHLLVDEFQDTNPTQWRLLLPLLSEMAAGDPERQRSVFLVGDAKQSIYRFRRADPRLLLEADQWLQTEMGARRFQQHRSWRSAPAIMRFVNKVFSTPPLDALIKDFETHDTHLSGLWGRVSVLPLISTDKDEEREQGQEVLRNPLTAPRRLHVDDRYLREGRSIALEIRHLVENRTIIGTGEDAHRIRYSDIMLLVRSRNHVSDYEQALREAAIPYLGALRGTLLESLEVRDMVALLNLLITPYNNLALAQVLRSPVFSCDNDALIQLAQSSDRTDDWMGRLGRLAGQLPSDSPLRYAAEKLQSWHQLAGHIPIHDLLDRVFKEGDVIGRYRAAFPEHLRPRVESNLTRFIELALEIDAGRYPSLTRFLERLEELRQDAQEAPDEAPAAGAQERVRIMTIHAAKGLEAPVVFLADATSGKERDRPFRAIVDWPTELARPRSLLLVGRKHERAPYTLEQLEHEARAEQRESANLLYVALTRARQLLYVSGCKPSRGEAYGWYGIITAALGTSTSGEVTEPLLLETGQPPAAAAAIVPPAEAAIELDPRLFKPFDTLVQGREIAPSHAFTSRHDAVGQGDEDGKLRGITIHRMLEMLCEHGERPWDELAGIVANDVRHDPQSADFISWWREACTLYDDPAFTEFFHPEQPVLAENEVPIIYQLEESGKTVHGIIDRLLVNDSEVWLVDYKTHAHATGANLSQFAAPYREQMGYYIAGIRRLWPDKAVRAILLFTACRQPFEITLE